VSGRFQCLTAGQFDGALILSRSKVTLMTIEQLRCVINTNVNPDRRWLGSAAEIPVGGR
jgi:hypothetical protein